MSPNLAQYITLSSSHTRRRGSPRSTRDEPGHGPARRYQGSNVERVPGGRHTFARSAPHALDGYRPGDERQLLAQIDKPPLVTVSGPAMPAAVRETPR
jgi:hypothetical protein